MTDEQQAVICAVDDPNVDLIKVSAVSGAGKTWTLQRLVEHAKPSSCIYLAYNNAIAAEARTKFKSPVVCKTVHSLAYQNTVRPFDLKVGYFGPRNVSYPLSYDNKQILPSVIEAFCLSEYTSFTKYCTDMTDYEEDMINAGEHCLKQMSIGAIDCTHAFYLKLYHILLDNGSIIHDTYDLLLLDEAGDLNPVTLRVFLLLPAVKKVLVGDPQQNIYSFNHTINGFSELANQGKLLTLSKSFRVSDVIANRIEQFMQEHVDVGFQFKGTKYDSDVPIKTRAYIARTNSKLIERMLMLRERGIVFSLTRNIKSIFATPLALLRLFSGKEVTNPELKYLNMDLHDYKSSPSLQKQYANIAKYIAYIHKDNVNIKTAINLIATHSPKAIWDLYFDLLAIGVAQKPVITLCTAHSSKGLEWDSVEIATDFNKSIEKILRMPRLQRTDEDVEELRLYYVAVSRCKMELTGAVFIDEYA